MSGSQSRLIGENSDVIVIDAESLGSRRSGALASEGLEALKRTGKPVLLIPPGCSMKESGSILVAISSAHYSPTSRWNFEKALDPAGKEVVVLSVTSPYYPVFSRVAVGMRPYQSEALREIWAEQANEASTPAEMMVDQLKKAGAKSWFVSRTGRFASEICKTAKSSDAALVCLLVDLSLRRRWFGKTELTDLLDMLQAPVLILPSEGV